MASDGVNAVPLTFEKPEFGSEDLDLEEDSFFDPQTDEPYSSQPQHQPHDPSLVHQSADSSVPSPLENHSSDMAPPAASRERTKPQTQTAQLKPSREQPQVEYSQQKTSRLIYYAQLIMETEGHRLGTACNFYVHRVLQATGFVHHVYLANDFHQYAKKYFKTYKAEVFKVEGSNSDVKRLKQYLWSYPERTPFIMNWTRPGRHGHIAIIERLNDKLVIYQASLGTKTPRKDQTTPERLLNGSGRRHLTVYSEMTPK